MDNQTTESGELSVEQAASLFTQVDDGEQEQQEVEVEAQAQAEPEAQEEIEHEQESEDANEEGSEPLHTVKVGGEVRQVTLDELKNGYQLQSNATKQTIAAAEVRKEAEAQMQQAKAERQQYWDGLSKAQAVIEAELNQFSQVDLVQLSQEDPVKAFQISTALQQRQAQLNEIFQRQAQLKQVETAELAKYQQDYLQQQNQALLDNLPEWKDEGKAKAEKTAIADYLKSQGFDDGTINQISDFRAVIIARKAMMFDKLQNKSDLAVKKVSAAPTKVIKSGGGEKQSVDKTAQLKARFNKSGSIDDAVALMNALS